MLCRPNCEFAIFFECVWLGHGKITTGHSKAPSVTFRPREIAGCTTGWECSQVLWANLRDSNARIATGTATKKHHGRSEFKLTCALHTRNVVSVVSCIPIECTHMFMVYGKWHTPSSNEAVLIHGSALHHLTHLWKPGAVCQPQLTASSQLTKQNGQKFKAIFSSLPAVSSPQTVATRWLMYYAHHGPYPAASRLLLEATFSSWSLALATGHIIYGKTPEKGEIWVLNEPKIGGFYPPKCMVKIMENPMNKWMIWVVLPLFLETPIWQNHEKPCWFDNFEWILFDLCAVQWSSLPTTHSGLKWQCCFILGRFQSVHDLAIPHLPASAITNSWLIGICRRSSCLHTFGEATAHIRTTCLKVDILSKLSCGVYVGDLLLVQKIDQKSKKGIETWYKKIKAYQNGTHH